MTTVPAFTCCNCGRTDATEWTNLHDGRWVCADCWWPVGRPT